MKPFSKTANKWLLSTMMIAVLGSQYYFSASSLNYGKFELSSTAQEELDQKIQDIGKDKSLTAEQREKLKKELTAKYTPQIEAEKKVKPVPKSKTVELQAKPVAAKAEVSVSAPAAAKSDKTEKASTTPAPATTPVPEVKPAAAAQTEGSTQSQFVVDCKLCGGTSRVTISGINEKTAVEIAKHLNPEKKVETPTVVEPKKEEPAVVETAQEKRERLKEEREEKKQAAKQKKEDARQAKLDKEQDAKEERNDKFTDKADEIAERCHDDLSCKANRMASLMREFSGRKKVDSFVVMKAYNTLIDKDLKAGLAGDDKQSTLQAIDTLLTQIPSEYKSLKTRAVDSVKYGQISQAATVNALFRQADEYQRQNKPNDAIFTRSQAMLAADTFKQEAGAIYSGIYEDLKSVGDNTTLDYVVNSYRPDINKLMSNLMSSRGVIGSETSTGSRAGRTGNSTVNISNGGAVISNTNSLNGVNFGTPSTNRTVNRTGLNFK